jgi:hypothetical protein
MIIRTGEIAMRVPITGHAVSVSDTVERAMEILKDRKNPAIQPSINPQSRSTPHQPHARHRRQWNGAE